MKRGSKIFGNLPAALHITTHTLQLDFGSETTRIALNGQVVVKQPTVALIHEHSGSLIEVGQEASHAEYQESRLVGLHRPIRGGQVIDTAIASEYLLQTLQKMYARHQISMWHRILGSCVIPSDSTPVERDLFDRVLFSVGGNWQLVTKAHIWQQLLSEKGRHAGFGGSLDVGLHTTEVCLLTRSGEVVATTVRVGMAEIIKEVITQLREDYGCLVSWQTAEHIHASIPRELIIQATTKVDERVAIRGKELSSGRPVTLTIEIAKLREVYSLFFADWLDTIQRFFAHLESGELAFCLDRGLILSGGGARLSGLANLVADRFETQVEVSPVADRELVEP